MSDVQTMMDKLDQMFGMYLSGGGVPPNIVQQYVQQFMHPFLDGITNPSQGMKDILQVLYNKEDQLVHILVVQLSQLLYLHERLYNIING
jgi:hypothetical protein